MVKNLPAVWGTWVQPPGWEDPWRRGPLPATVFLAGEPHGQRRLPGRSPWGCKELDKTEQLSLSLAKELNKMFRNYKKIVIN